MRIRGVGASRSVETSPSCLPPFLIGKGPCLAVVFRQAGGIGLRIREEVSPGHIVVPWPRVIISRLTSTLSPPLGRSYLLTSNVSRLTALRLFLYRLLRPDVKPHQPEMGVQRQHTTNSQFPHENKAAAIRKGELLVTISKEECTRLFPSRFVDGLDPQAG